MSNQVPKGQFVLISVYTAYCFYLDYKTEIYEKVNISNIVCLLFMRNTSKRLPDSNLKLNKTCVIYWTKHTIFFANIVKRDPDFVLLQDSP